MYSIRFTTNAQKRFKKLPKEIQKRIIERLNEIRKDPFDEVKMLKTSNKTPIYSLRVGEYRVIMRIYKDKLLVLITKVGHRSTVYREI
jgi:mRNA interferase RelE/StbE